MVSRNTPSPSTYVLAFFLALHIALPLYINSSLLATVIQEKYVGLVFTAASLIILLAISYFRHILERLGNFLTLQWVMVGELTALSVFLYTSNPLAIILAMVAYMVASPLIAFSMDIFLEKTTINKKTGIVRGKYLTATSAGAIAAPFIISILFSGGNYAVIYFTSISILALVFLMFVCMYGKFEDPRYEKVTFIEAWKAIRVHHNILRICSSNFLLYLFYAVMVVYTPIYLSQHIGFSWNSIGQIFTIMLLPFLLLQFPLGWLADKKYGEKEILAIGFAVTALSTGMLTFITSTNPLVWGLALLATRVGASMIEIMNETYFFKKTDSADTPKLMFFTMTRPIGFIVGPALASATFIFFDFPYIFLVTGIILLAGIAIAFKLKDTN